jgi:cobalamin biosynthetic protein CobC
MAAIAHGGGLAEAIVSHGGSREAWLDLSTGINPVMPDIPDLPRSVLNRLPDSDLVAAARMAARDWYLGGGEPSLASEDCLPLAVPGTQAFIQILPRLVPFGRPVAILSPTYGEYAHCFAKAGFAVDAIADLDQLGPQHGTLIVVNPNNPDGRTLSREELERVHAMLSAQGGHLHVDEAFGDGRSELSVARLAARSAGLTVSRSFGKVFGMAGVRLGFLFALPETLAAVQEELGPWSVSGPALFLATQLMRRDRAPLMAAIGERRKALQMTLDSAGLVTAGGTELFALVEHDRAGELFEHLARAHILVRKFGYAPRWLRIGLAPDAEGDERLAASLSTFQNAAAHALPC